MKKKKYCILYYFYIAIVIILAINVRFTEGGKRRIHVTDDLNDVIDNEEDEAWREWGKKSSPSMAKFDPPPTDFENMDLHEIQEQMLKRQLGPVFGFVKLRFGIRRTRDMVSDIAIKWNKLSRTGAIEIKFMAMDLSTIMFTMERGQDAVELREFVLSQSEAYEVKIGDHIFRREGDPPLEEVMEKLKNEKIKKDSSDGKDEL
ncbi:uncharacterized protein LOC124921428 [Impatiens glandulifera]|uniref:uncharacterized protein LOC124921428 n=1 Tax=Impatiens glandulifera TaxID=253017 RepID=UPI001FB0D321|nr:uncharacterized protein LOC124921428 [Impatiens glandulifera]